MESGFLRRIGSLPLFRRIARKAPNALQLAYLKYNLRIPSTAPIPSVKTIFLSVCLAVAASNAYSDAIKYRQANGQIMITNQPTAEGARELSVQRDDYVPPIHRQTAINDLQRQKEFLRARESENLVVVARSGHTGNAVNSGSTTDMTQLYGCLQKVTATFGQSPSQEASRKVSCYSGTSGLNDDCQRSVAATMRLSNREESLYKSYCPR